VLTSADNTTSHYIPISLINEGNFDLDEYIDLLLLNKEHLIKGYESEIPYYLVHRHDRYLAKNSPLGGIINLPIFAITSYFLDLNFGHWIIVYLSKLTATILITLSAAFIFFSSRRLTTEKNSFLITFIFSFCSNVWVIASQDLWNHTVSIFFISMSIYFLVRALKEQSYIKYLGFSLFGAVFARSSNFFFALIFTLYVIFYYHKYLRSFFLYATPLISLFLAYNLFYKSGITNIFLIIFYVILLNFLLFILLFSVSFIIKKFKRKHVLIMFFSFLILIFVFSMNFRIASASVVLNSFADMIYLFMMSYIWTAPFFEGFFGLLLNPSRGLFIFSPIFFFSFFFLFSLFKTNKKTKLEILYFYLFLSIISLILFFAKYFQWYGGWTYGYRMILDLVPILCILLIPSLKIMMRKSFLKKLFFLFVAISFLIQILGILSYDNSWNAGADYNCNIDICPERVWSLKDSQIIHYLQTPRINYCYPALNPFNIICKEKYF